MNDFLLMFAIVYFGLLIPLIMCASKKTKPAVVILCGIFFCPIIGWIVYLLLDDATKQTAAQKLAIIQGTHSEDPMEKWEREQRIAQGPPPPPASYYSSENN